MAGPGESGSQSRSQSGSASFAVALPVTPGPTASTQRQGDPLPVGFKYTSGGALVAISYSGCRKKKEDDALPACPGCDSVVFYHHKTTGNQIVYHTCLTKKIATCLNCCACASLITDAASDDLCVCPMRDPCKCGGHKERLCERANCVYVFMFCFLPPIKHSYQHLSDQVSHR